MLLKAKADANAVTWRGMTPLDYAQSLRAGIGRQRCWSRPGRALAPWCGRLGWCASLASRPQAPVRVDGEFACRLPCAAAATASASRALRSAQPTAAAGVDRGRAVPGACVRRGGILRWRGRLRRSSALDAHADLLGVPAPANDDRLQRASWAVRCVSDVLRGAAAARPGEARGVGRPRAARRPAPALWSFRHHGNPGVRPQRKPAAQAQFRRKARPDGALGFTTSRAGSGRVRGAPIRRAPLAGRRRSHVLGRHALLPRRRRARRAAAGHERAERPAF